MTRMSSDEFDVSDDVGFDLGTALGTIVTGVAQSAGVDPDIIKAGQDALSSPIAKAGFNAGLQAAAGAISKSGAKGAAAPAAAPPAVHADPAVRAAKAALPADARSGFDAGAALVAAHAAGGAVPGLPPAAQAAQLIALGAPKKLSWWRLGLSAVGTAGVAFFLGANLPITVVAAAVGPTVLHVFGKDKAA